MQESGPIAVTGDGQVVENVSVKGQLSIRAKGVTVRNVQIEHDEHGLFADGADNLTMENVSVVNPMDGRKLPSERNNIHVQNSRLVTGHKIRVARGSSGIYMVNCPDAHLSMIEGYNQRGPFPRGQLVQFNACHNSILEDFSAVNLNATSWTEDNVSVYRSRNCIVRRGFIDGNNSPSGVGVMFEESDDGLCEDVDVIRMGNGCFSAYPSHRVVFRRTRARDNICSDQRGEGPPKSKALVWAGEPSSTGLSIEDSKYFNLCNPNNLVWDRKTFDVIEIAEEDFTPRDPIVLVFPWEGEPAPDPDPDPDPVYATKADLAALEDKLRQEFAAAFLAMEEEQNARWQRIFNPNIL